MKKQVKRFSLWLYVALTIMAPVHLYAACQIVGTTINGYIIVCEGSDTTGVISGNGNDVITINTGAQVCTTDLQSVEAVATAGTTAIDAGNGNNRITNQGSVGANVGATASLQVDTPSQATAKATAIKAGSGADVIRNSSTITSTATSNSQSGGANATSEATAIGIDAGDGNDRITNNSAITATSTATASSNGVTLTGIGIGTYASPTDATANSKGIEAGKGSDTIINNKDITSTATSTANALNVSIGLFEYEVKTYGDASTKAIANATGVAGSDGNDRVTNAATGTITATSNATASTKDISVEFVGGVKINSSTTAYASSTGIDGGNGNDTITNNGAITVKAISDVDAVGVDAKLLGIPTKLAEWLGANVGDAKTGAQSSAKGIDGGEGDNKITNSGTIDVYAKANADSTDVATSVNVNILGGGATPQASVSSGNLQVPSSVGATGASTQTSSAGTENSGESNGITDVGTIARAYATGIDGGTGGNTITNNNKILVKAESEADSVSVSPSISISKGGLTNIYPGTALTNATTTAQSTATGIVGGASNDTINNRSELSSESISNSTSTSVSVLFKGVKEKGLAWGGALSDATTQAISTTTGIDGGGGNDTITNSGTIKATATPGANSTSVGVTLMGVEEGLTTGFTYVDAKTTAEATAIGIEGDTGNDTITNKRTREIDVTANPTSSSVSVGVTVSGAFSQEWIAAIGGSITDEKTQATSNATGISGGDGNDTITNSGKVTVNALPDAHSAGVSVGLVGAGDGLTVGFTYSDAKTTAEATAIGIDGGSGNDTITNKRTGEIDVTANPTSSSVSVGVTLTGVTKGTGIVGGAALTDGTTTATGNVTGISGGEGNDTITNAGKIIVGSNPDASSASVSVNLGASTGELGLVGGVSYANATTTAQATAVGIDGGSGNDTITNKRTGEIDVTANPTSSSASVGVTAEGVKGMGAAVGISLTDGTTKAISTATGIAGGDGDDTIINSGKITVNALSEAHSASVSVSLSAAKEGVAAGGTFADATTTAQATGVGIDGGAGNDTITNSGTIQVTSTASMAAASVSVNAGVAVTGVALGAALADGKTVATSSAIGIDGGAGDNTLTNRGSNTVSATSDVTAASVGVNLEGTKAGLAAGVSLVDGENKAEALAIGIRGGSGNDTIRNDNTTRAEATATSTRTNVAFSGTFALYGVALGASAADATNTAAADARGIEGGGGNDKITNTSDLVTVATTTADTNSVSVSANVAIYGVGLGASIAKAETTGSALVTGIDAGNGDNTITNTSTGSIDSTSNAHVDTLSVSVNLLGAVGASAGFTASATSVGISSGGGTDTIRNEGNINLTATSNTDASAYAVQLAGYGDSNAKGVSNATVKGIDGGDGVNTLINIGSITGTATANANASSYDIQLGGGAKTTAGTEANATAIGIAGGKDMDTIRNEGTINLSAQSILVSSSRSYQIFGVGLADADSKASAIATGIDGGDGNNTITNTSTGSITASSNASATATGMAATIGVAGSSASTTSNAHSTGIKSGDGEDTIYNYGNINVTATSQTTAAGGSFSLVGLSFGDSVTEAIAEGINAGGGKNTIINTGSITVGSVQDNDHPMAYSEVVGVSFSFADIASATFGSKAQATGIIGGGGDDTIINTGTITVGDDHWMAKGWAYGISGNFISFFDLSSVGATAEAVSTGIDGGEGNNSILNDSSGVLTVKATSYAKSEGAGDSTFGGTAVFASSTTIATATGISAGGGDNTIENRGQIDVYAHTWADAYTDSKTFWGSPYADSTANATATATGIDAGGGQNLVTNSGAINVSALAETTPYAKANSDIDTTDAKLASYSQSSAFGIQAGDGNNTVNNMATGTVTVTAVARTGTYDAQGNLVIAKADSDEKATATAGDLYSPITSNAVGISLGNGDNTVTNDGTLKVSSQSDAWVSAHTDSWPNAAQSDATAYATATAKGITAGLGANEVINNGQINVSAWSHANPITDSYSRDKTATANAVAGSTATATGIEADGNITNALHGSMTVTARATTDADANTYAETTTATANLMATATGISTASSTGRAVPDRIQNDGTLTVHALSGEDENGNPQTIALADTQADVRSNRAETAGTSTANAAGIRISDHDAVITNNGELTVLGRARAYLNANAFSRDYNPTANAHSNANSSAVGIQAGGGSNTIRNSSLIHVDALAEAQAQGWADSWSSTTYTNAYASSIASGTGVSVGNGDNIIDNEGSGTINVNSTATSITSASSDENANAMMGVDNNTVVASNAIGIQAGGGNNLIFNDGQITVVSEVDANSHASASSYSALTATATAKTGGSADATGIKVGDGNNTIKNNGTLTVTANNIGIALSDYPSAHLDNGYAYAGGGDTSLSSNATGISAGNGDNLIENHNAIVVTSTVSANAQAYASTISTTTDAEAYAGGDARATGILVGDGQNTIKNYGNMTVSATANAYALGSSDNNGSAYIGSESSPGIVAEAVGISAGRGINTITNYGTLAVNATATAIAQAQGDESTQAVANSYATATGILTGDGPNTVTNLGTMNVTASGSGASAVASAVGIRTGSNDDRVIIGPQGTLTVRASGTTFFNNTALATGIDAGNGNNHVENYGSIDVTAEAMLFGFGNTHLQSFGIKTGSGDDLIINGGRISTNNRLLYSSSPGIAISSGAGNDTVILMNGSETIGDIDLGAGDDQLILVGTPLVTGNVTGGAGFDTLVFQGAGSIGFTPTDFEQAIKQGAGTFTVPSLPTMQRIEIKQGVLQVNNNYQFSNSGLFQTVVNGDGSFGQFKVNGTTQLAGDLSVLKGPGPFLNGTTYNIIEANAINNAFSNVMLPPPNNFVSFGIHQLPTLVQIEAYVKDFTWLATNRVEWAVANYLDRIVPSATGDLCGMLGQIQNLSQSNFYKALSTLSPDSYDDFTRTTFSETQRYTKSLQYRMNNVRSYLYASEPGNEAPILLAYRGSDVSQLFSPEGVSQIQGKNGLWFDAFGQWGDQDEENRYHWDGGYTGFDYFMRGATLGFDCALTERLMAGVSVGYSRSDIDLDHDQGSGYIQSLYGSIYGSYFYKNLYIDGILSYGKNWYDNHRLITIGADQREAYSKHDGDLFSAFLGAGYYFDIKKWLIGPFATLQYIYLDEESFREKGAGSVSLDIDGRKTNSLVSELGVRLARVFKSKYGSLIPEVSAAWLHDFDIDGRVITSSFAGSPGASFSIKGQDVEKNGATLGTGITFIYKSRLSTSLKYIGEFREKYKSNGVMGEIRYTF